MATKPTVNKLKVFEKLSNAGFADDKSILKIDETIVFNRSFTRDELIVVVQMKEAVKKKKLYAYLADPTVNLEPPDKEG